MIKTPSTEPFTPDKLPDGAFRTILDELLRSERTIAEIAGEFKLSFVQLQQLLESPEAQAEFAALKVVAAIRHDATAPIRRENALARLTHIAAFNLDEASGRRAATTLLRELRIPLPAHSAPGGPPLRGGPDQSASTPAFDKPTTLPVPPTGLPVGAADSPSSNFPEPAKPIEAPSQLETRDSRLPFPPTALPVTAAEPQLLLTTSNPKPKHANHHATTAKSTTPSSLPHPTTHTPRALLATH